MRSDCPFGFHFACGLFIALWLLANVGNLAAQEDLLLDSAKTSKVAPWLEDATLRDVQFLGRMGWAVGDHGVVWHTPDNGLTWTLQPTPIPCSLRSVHFLTDSIGWIAGGYSQPYSHIGTGVIFSTSDGGKSWKRIGGEELPEFHRVKFFTMKNGVAVGEPSATCSTGVMFTSDGGQTWRAAPGIATGSWRAADFLHPEAGTLGGLNGQRAIVGGGQVSPHKLGNLGLQGIQAIRLGAGGQGWLVGDGGLILSTKTAGVTWETIGNGLSREARSLFDFRAVAVSGSQVWIAGDPGSIIWHSSDNGQTWEPQPTRNATPIHGISFANPMTGYAVGAMGSVLKTEDGGQTWLPVRGAGRRAAYLALLTKPERISIPLVEKLSAESGYRGVVSLLPRFDTSSSNAQRPLDLQAQEAVMLARGSGATLGWRWPLDIPGLESNPERLLEEWSRRSEGELEKALRGHLVRQLRTWKPSILIVDEPSKSDALGRFLLDQLRLAMDEAGDPTRWLDHTDLAVLEPWRVEKLFLRVPQGQAGSIQLTAYDMLPRMGQPLGAAAEPARARLFDQVVAGLGRETYRAVNLRDESAPVTGQDFFAGVSITPGSPARRELPPVDEADLALKMKLARQQRNFQAIVENLKQQGRNGQHLLAQMDDVVRGLPDDQAALQLAQLADSYRRNGEWDLAESTLIALVERYPHEPPAVDAMRWLFQLWVGVEPSYRRARGLMQSNRKQFKVDKDELVQRMERAAMKLEANAGRLSPEEALNVEIEQVGATKPTLSGEDAPLKIRLGGVDNMASGQTELWHSKAQRMAEALERFSPQWYRSPAVQCSLASLFRQRQQTTEAARIYHHFAQGTATPDWEKTATTEIWLSQGGGLPPKAIYACNQIATPPELDGVLTDQCWQAASELPLNERTAEATQGEPGLVLMCRDAEYLYFAGIFPRHALAPLTGPQPGRSYDTDLSAYDRVTVCLDVDRDYNTYYRFSFDQRGWTAEDCWGDASWNPRYHVAANADETTWRIEVAIPWTELVPEAPPAEAIWAASVVRIIPAVGTQSWTATSPTIPRLESGGLLRFAE